MHLCHLVKEKIFKRTNFWKKLMECILKWLKYGFCKKSLRKHEPLTSRTLLWAYLSSLLGGCANPPKLVGSSSFRSYFLQNPYFKHVKSQWKRLGGKWAVCQAVITRDERDMIKDVLGSNVGKNLINADLFNSNFTNEDFQNIPIPHL